MRRSFLISFLSAFAFSVHALFNDSHSWPLLWPLIGGVLAVTISRRHGSYRYSSIVQSGVMAGLLAWLICFFAGLIISEDTITHYYNEFNDPARTHPSLMFASAAMGLTFIAAWLFSSGVTTVVTKRKAV
jgi:hypothetical protein